MPPSDVFIAKIYVTNATNVLAPLSKFQRRVSNRQSEAIDVKGVSSKISYPFSISTMVAILLCNRDAVNGGP